MPDICVVDPGIVLHCIERLVKIANAKVRVVVRVVDDKEIPRWFQHSMAFSCPGNAGLNVLVKLRGVRLSLVLDTHIVVGVCKNAVYRLIVEVRRRSSTLPLKR